MNPDSKLFKLLEFYGTRLHHRGQWKIHAMLREWLKPNVDVDLEVVRDGHRWLLNPSDFVQTEFFWLGERDTWDIRHAKRLIHAGDVLLDVGANFGHYSITLADAVGRACEIHAFEPFPPNADRLRTNIRLNGLERHIHVHPVGLSDSSGVGKMMIRADNSGAATLAVTEEAAVGARNIELTTLDAFCERHGIAKVDFIKVDVEGFEEKMVSGGTKTIERFAPNMLIEFDPPKLTRAGSSVDRLAAQLRQLRYGLWVAERDRLVPLKDLPRGQDYINVFCIPESSRQSIPQG
ncbi:MAG: FkbM family methyltransferase [Nitrospira sp. CR1.3]|nr:FkbM family methyltransferase [Nitrospira sp. CR1.3]